MKIMISNSDILPSLVANVYYSITYLKKVLNNKGIWVDWLGVKKAGNLEKS